MKRGAPGIMEDPAAKRARQGGPAGPYGGLAPGAQQVHPQQSYSRESPFLEYRSSVGREGVLVQRMRQLVRKHGQPETRTELGITNIDGSVYQLVSQACQQRILEAHLRRPRAPRATWRCNACAELCVAGHGVSLWPGLLPQLAGRVCGACLRGRGAAGYPHAPAHCEGARRHGFAQRCLERAPPLQERSARPRAGVTGAPQDHALQPAEGGGAPRGARAGGACARRARGEKPGRRPRSCSAPSLVLRSDAGALFVRRPVGSAPTPWTRRRRQTPRRRVCSDCRASRPLVLQRPLRLLAALHKALRLWVCRHNRSSRSNRSNSSLTTTTTTS